MPGSGITSAPATTPSTLQAMAPSAERPQPNGTAARKAPQRSGKDLWKTAAVKLHTYHAVTHQVQHRGAEKVGFGGAEHLLERVVEATIDRASTGAAHGARPASWLHRLAASKPIKLVQAATCRLVRASARARLALRGATGRRRRRAQTMRCASSARPGSTATRWDKPPALSARRDATPRRQAKTRARASHVPKVDMR